MKNLTRSKVFIPLAYTTAFAISLFLGIKGLDKNGSEFSNFLIGSYAIYSVFIIEGIFRFLEIGFYEKFPFGHKIFLFMAGIILVFFVTIIATGTLYFHEDCKALRYVILFLMVIHRFGMAYFDCNKENFYFKVGETFTSN